MVGLPIGPMTVYASNRECEIAISTGSYNYCRVSVLWGTDLQHDLVSSPSSALHSDGDDQVQEERFDNPLDEACHEASGSHEEQFPQCLSSPLVATAGEDANVAEVC